MATTFKQIENIRGSYQVENIAGDIGNYQKTMDLYLTRYAGGRNQGRLLQITLGDATASHSNYAVLNKKQVKELLQGCIEYLSEDHLLPYEATKNLKK